MTAHGTFTLNGEARPWRADLTVERLLSDLSLAPRKVAVERNREIVPRSLYAQTALTAGDEVEIVTFVGGG